MLSYIEIARKDEALCARAIAQLAPESINVAGGVACRAWPGSWINRADGVGMLGPVDASEVVRIAEFHHQAGLDSSVKVNPYADESLLRALAETGYTTRRFEQVMFRTLDHLADLVSASALPAELEVRRIDPHDEPAVRAAAELCVNTFATPQRPAVAADVGLSQRAMQRPDAITLGVYHQHTCVASGGLEWLGDLATLYGLVVDPRYRRRGIQQHLIAARLRLAAERGLRLATIGCSPGIPTERNAARLGFHVAYTRAVMVKPLPA